MHLCWSVKGGSGTTVFASALALALAAKHGSATIVDIGGDVPSVLGVADPSGRGVRDWLAARSSNPQELAALRIGVTNELGLVPAGSATSFDVLELGALNEVFADEHVVVDCGLMRPDDDLRRRANADWLVVRPCYLALRRAAHLTARPGGVVLLTEEGRALTSRDVSSITGSPVVAHVRVRSDVARSVDAGLLATRLPLALAHDLEPLL